MTFPISLIEGRWPTWMQRRLRRLFWPDPIVLVEAEPDPVAFGRLVSGLHGGTSTATTGAVRHEEADRLLTDNVDTTAARVVDLGASDGTSTLDLLRALPGVRELIIADRHLRATVVRTRKSMVVLDDSGNCVLVATRRMLAWPGRSRVVAALIRPLSRRARRRIESGTPIALLNPALSELMATDQRINTRFHDVFTVWPEPKPDVIKVANLLRRQNFSDEKLLEGLNALIASLPEDGHLLLVDNPRTADPTPRAGLYRRVEGRLDLVAQTRRDPELADLIDRALAPARSGPAIL